MRLLTLLFGLLLVPLIPLAPTATAEAECVDTTLCAGEASQTPCGGPAPYGDGWDNFTGVWGETAGIEYGAGGWDRCYPGYWSAGAFVNMDEFPLGQYETVQARFDYSPTAARPCYLSAGAYGYKTQFALVRCPDGEVPDPNPGWGSVLG